MNSTMIHIFQQELFSIINFFSPAEKGLPFPDKPFLPLPNSFILIVNK